MFNKAKYTLDKSKKILHKVKKQWVAISVVMLGLIGGAAVTTTPIHVDANSNNNQSSTITEQANQLHSNLVNNAIQTQRPTIQLGAESNDENFMSPSDQTNNYTNSDSWSDFNNTNSYSDNMNNSDLNNYSMSDDNFSNSTSSDDFNTPMSSSDNNTSYSNNSWSDMNNDNYPSDNNSWNSLSDNTSYDAGNSDVANYSTSDNNQISKNTNVIPSDYSYNNLPSDYTNSNSYSYSDLNNSFLDSTFPSFGYDSDFRWKSFSDSDYSYSYVDYNQSSATSDGSNYITYNIWPNSFESNVYSDYSLSSSDSSQASLSSNSYNFSSSVSTKSSGSRPASSYKGAIKVDGITCIPSADGSYNANDVISQITINGVNYVQISDDSTYNDYLEFSNISNNGLNSDGINVLPSASDSAISINNTTYLALSNAKTLDKNVKHTNSDVNIDGTDFVPAKYVSAKSIIGNYHERNVQMDQATYNFYKPYFESLNPVPTLSDVNNMIASNSGSLSDFTNPNNNAVNSDSSDNTLSVTLSDFPQSDIDRNPKPFVSKGLTYVPVDNYENYSDDQIGGGVSSHVDSDIPLLIKSGINYVPEKYTEHDGNGYYYSIDSQYITTSSYMTGIDTEDFDNPSDNHQSDKVRSDSDVNYSDINPSSEPYDFNNPSDYEIGGKGGTADPYSDDTYSDGNNNYNSNNNPSDATGYSDETNYDID